MVGKKNPTGKGKHAVPTFLDIIGKKDEDFRDDHVVQGNIGSITASFYKEGNIGLKSPEDLRHIMLMQPIFDGEGNISGYHTTFITPREVRQLWRNEIYIEGVDKGSLKQVSIKAHPSTVYVLDSETGYYYSMRPEADDAQEIKSFE